MALGDTLKNLFAVGGFSRPPQNAMNFQVGEGLEREGLASAQKAVGVTPFTQYSKPIGPESANPANIEPSGAASTGATGAPSGTGAGGRVLEDIDTTPYDQAQARLNAESSRREEQAREQAGSIFDPLARNFDTQLGRLGGELGDLRGGVERGAEAGRNLVNEQLNALFGTLSGQEENVRGETKKSLRNLAEDQRNTTTSIARQLGARGAGDTSAGDYAGAAIGRQGLKQRGSALESQAQGIREIEGRRVQVQSQANQELQRIEAAKHQQLNSLASDFQNIQRQLESAKAQATSDERRFIADQQNKLRDELSNRLSDLESEARNRKAALQDWGTQQEAQLQNSLRRLAATGRYDSTDVLKNLSKAASLIGNTNLTPQGVDYVTEAYNVPSGLFDTNQGPSLEDQLTGLKIQEAQQGIDQRASLLSDQQSPGILGSIGNALLPGQPY